MAGAPAYYHTEQQQIVDNPDQRIAEDLNVLTQYTLSLSLGLLSSPVTLFSFIDILWHVSGPMTFALGQHAITLPGYMVWFALLYAVLGSLLIWWVGKPLVMLGFNQERYEANFRFGLIRIRENNDAIALYHGEPREAQQLGDRFDTIRSNWWAIMRITRRLNIATNFYGQFAIVFPLLVAAPRYFSGAIQMGGLMQIASAFGRCRVRCHGLSTRLTIWRPESLRQPFGRLQRRRRSGASSAARHSAAGRERPSVNAG